MKVEIVHERGDALASGEDLEKLRKDKARLDWLADANNSIGIVKLPRDIVERNLSSLRDAIDDAMLIESTRG